MSVKNYGETAQQRVLWMAMFAQGVDGRRGLPYVLQGKPGAAKSATVRRLFSMAGIPFESVLGSLRSPTDFLGVPVPQRRQLCAADQHLSPDGDADFLYMHYAPSGFAVRAALAKRYGLLFDEVSTCPPSVQAALLRVLFEGVVGELQLPPGVRMILAMNHVQDAAGGWDIAPPLANRMGWLEWSPPNVKDFANFLVGGCKTHVEAVVDPAEEEARVDAAWNEEFARAAGAVAGFLSRRPELLLAMPKDDAARAWPSPRTWEFFTRALAGSAVYGLDAEETMLACAAFVGDSAFSEFYAWQKAADIPDPKDVLNGAVTFKHNPARLDRTAAVLSSVGALTIAEAKNDTLGYTVKCWGFVGGLLDAGDEKADASDVILPTVTTLCQAKLMAGNPQAYKILAKLAPVMRGAGIMQ